MPYNHKEYMKKYREANKETIKEYNKEYMKKYYKEYGKNYKQTEEGKKTQRILNWKYYKVICDDFDKLYEYYLNCKFCEECNVELVEGNRGKYSKCLDHDHKTGLFRNVLCNTCNIKRGFNDNNIVRLTNSERMWKYRLRAFILS